MLQREIPPYVNVVVAKLARELGKPVFMDVGGTDAPLDEALMPFLTVIAPNESELTFITGVETKGADGAVTKPLVREAVAALKAKFAAVGNPGVEALVTLGGQGSIHFGAAWSPAKAPEFETRMGSFDLKTADGKPKDTTGAGDCFRGSFVAAHYGQGMPVEAAMRWASAAGSLAVEIEGAMPSMPPKEKIASRAEGKVSFHSL